jgi:hypothetical protein
MNHGHEATIIPFPRAGDGRALLLRVDLLLMPAPVWRRLLIPAAATFWDLHVALQDAFGWEDRHLHQFTADDVRRGVRLRFGLPDDEGIGSGDDVLPGWRHGVRRFLRPDLASVLYVYDFGDSWVHEICCEEVRTVSGDVVLPGCLSGERWAPAEDCGGPAAVKRSDICGDVAFAPESVKFSDPQRHLQRVFADD